MSHFSVFSLHTTTLQLMSALSTYLSRQPTKKLKKGELVLIQNEAPRHALAVKSGIIRVYNLTADGVEKCITYYIQHDIFPVSWLFSKTDRSLYYYQAHTDGEVAAIEKDAFHAALQHDPGLAREVLSAQVNTNVQLMLRINSLEQPRATTKLLNMFQLLCLRYGKSQKEHLVEVTMPMTQQEIADFTGLTRETATLELKKLRDLKIITCRHKTYRVRTDLLNEHMTDEFNPGIHIESEKGRKHDKTKLNTTPAPRPSARPRTAYGTSARI